MESFSIKQITDETGLSGDTLRFYEKDGLLSDIQRLPNGHRRYTRADLEWLRFVVCLKNTGMPLKKIKKYKSLINLGDETAAERKILLEEQKLRILNEMEVLQESLKVIDFKIEYYQSIEKNFRDPC